MKLRPYQKTLVDELNEGVVKYRRVIAYSATGSGKSVVMGCLVKQFLDSGKKVLVLSNRTEILSQNFRHIANFGYEAELVNPKNKDIPKGLLAIGMSQTLRRRVERQEWASWVKTIDVCMLDEAHEAVSDFVHSHLRTDAYVIGYTGTPCRYGKTTQLGSLYGAIVSSISVRELIDMGYLAKPKLYSIVAPSLDDVDYNYTTGDYSQPSLAKKYESKTHYVGVVQEWLRICPKAKTIVFCVSSEQAIETTKEFCANGISAKYVLSGSFDSDEVYSGERDEVMEAFRNNEFQVLCNVGICVSGTDVVDIECAILDFATVSMAKYRQAIGRAARVTPTKKSFYLLDAGANYKRLGKYEDDFTVCLWHDTGVGNGVQQLKLCDPTHKDRNGKFGCNTMVPATCQVCPKCGKVLVDKQWEMQCHLEEVIENTENDIERWCCQRKAEGWKTPRILIQLCIANPDNMKKAFTIGYKAITGKDDAEANKYYFVFRKQFGDKLKRKKPAPRADGIQELNF